MKIFISWSGDRSRAVADLLSDWIKCVLQATRPWLSTRNIDRGALWFTEIQEQLSDTTVGIVCLTLENRTRPWILFESGALAKGLPSSRVCTFLVDLKPADVENPLGQFNHTLPERDSVLELVRTLNTALGSNGLDDRILRDVFNTYWPQFEERFAKILTDFPPTEESEPRPDTDILAEILNATRSVQSRIARLEARTEPSNADVGRTEEQSFYMYALDRARRWRETGESYATIDRKLAELGVPRAMLPRILSEISPGSRVVNEE